MKTKNLTTHFTKKILKPLAILFMPLAFVACLVPDPAPSETTPNGTQPAAHISDIPYGSDINQKLDIWFAPGNSSCTLVEFHAGIFWGGDKANQSAMASQLWTLGCDVVSANYRLADGVHDFWPAQKQDAHSVINWVDANKDVYGLGGKVIAVGQSSGATMSTVAALDGAPVAGWVEISGIMSWVDGLPSDPWGRVIFGYQGHPSSVDASAVNHLNAGDPPGWIIHGKDDPTVSPWNAIVMASKAKEAGVAVNMDFVDTGSHDCTAHSPLCGANLQALRQWIQLI